MTTTIEDPWAAVVGQSAAVNVLHAAAAGDAAHAWLFIGPHGSGKRAAARAFAGDLLAAEHAAAGDDGAAARARSLAAVESHPDLVIVERVGASIQAKEADEIIRRASRSATEGNRKVLVLDEFHLLRFDVAPRLLKTIEEPPGNTVFIVLADELPEDLVTIASRCVRVDFAPLTPAVIVDQLQAEGVAPEHAAEVASFADGDMDRARLLVADERLALRLAAWRDLPRRLDGSGAAATAVIGEIRAAIDDAEAPLKARHEAEVAEMQAQVERYGQRGQGTTEMAARHKRESRRLRNDELRMGLSVLAAAYREEMAVAGDPTITMAAIEAITESADRLVRNPNEELQLSALALRLPTLA